MHTVQYCGMYVSLKIHEYNFSWRQLLDECLKYSYSATVKNICSKACLPVSKKNILFNISFLELEGQNNMKILCLGYILLNTLNTWNNYCFLVWHCLLVYIARLRNEFNCCFCLTDNKLDYSSVITHLRSQN